MFRSVRLAVVASIGIIAATQSALAAAPAGRVEVGRVTVSYSDLNLGKTADAHLMLARLQHAAYRACGGDPRLNPNYDLMAPALDKAYQECRSDAVSRAVTAVNAPVLSEVFKGEDAQRLARATR